MSPLPSDPQVTPYLGTPAPPAEHPALTVQAYGMTDRGRVRPQNEDNFLIAELTKALRIHQSSLPQARTQYSPERGYLFLVADGMGGHQGGEQASALVVQSIEDFVLRTFKWFFHLRGPEEQAVLREFQEALMRADARLFGEAAVHPELAGMGTTLTLAYSLNPYLYVLHVGDSRCYLFHGGLLQQVTHDHTLVQEMVRRGVLSPEEAADNRLRHVITNVIGGNQAGIGVETHKLRPQAGDVLVLCSDGLTEMVPPANITAILRAEPEPQEACQRLVAEANARGGRDNITVVVVRYDSPI